MAADFLIGREMDPLDVIGLGSAMSSGLPSRLNFVASRVTRLTFSTYEEAEILRTAGFDPDSVSNILLPEARQDSDLPASLYFACHLALRKRRVRLDAGHLAIDLAVKDYANRAAGSEWTIRNERRQLRTRLGLDFRDVGGGKNVPIYKIRMGYIEGRLAEDDISETQALVKESCPARLNFSPVRVLE